jgi:hypothetical protein
VQRKKRLLGRLSGFAMYLRRSARKGLEIVAAVVTLAAALASGDAKRIVAAGKAVAALG